MPDERSARETRRADLKMAVCNRCGYVFNATFDLSMLSYGAEYDNTQTCSPYFASYVGELARYLITEKNVKHCTIVEVGSGKGGFLRSLVRDPEDGNTGLGFDPSHEGPLEELDGRLKFHRGYYGPEWSTLKADVVVSRHVIEHVPIPTALLDSVRAALSSSPRARVFFETPCVEWILRRKVVWDFFYEHCSLFSPLSIRSAFEASGFRVDDVRHVFDEQYLWVEATVSPEPIDVKYEAGAIPQLASEFAAAEANLTESWRRWIYSAAATGPVAIWGAGAKGATFSNLVDPKRELIRCVIDLNPRKQGCFIGGTGHPIVDYRAITPMGIGTVLMMNPNYLNECRELLKRAGIRANLVSTER